MEHKDLGQYMTNGELDAIVKKAVEGEREACAILCEETGYTSIECVTAKMDKEEAERLKKSKEMWLSTKCAEAIRARSKE